MAQQGPLNLGPENQRRLQKVVQAMTSDFDTCWADVLGYSINLQKITTYLFRARVLNAYEPCLVAQIHLSGAEASARLIWCFPRVMLESVMDQLTNAQVVPTLYHERVKPSGETPGEMAEKITYGLGVSLGSVNLTHGGKPFGVGSVLPISNDSGADAVIHINGIPVFVGSIGEVDGKLAVRIAGDYDKQKPLKTADPAKFSRVSWPNVKG